MAPAALYTNLVIHLSMRMFWPVMQGDLSEARKATGSATSPPPP